MQRDLDWDGCRNIRDLGGFETADATTAYGVFVRADNARNLSDDGWRAALAYGIRTVLDLRSERECAADPPERAEIAHVRLSLFDHFDGDLAYRADLLRRVAELCPAERYRLLYEEALELDAVKFAEAFAALAGADGAVLFHCVGGKDRTGVLAALLLKLAGVAVDAIDDDYVRSEQRLGPSQRAGGHDVGSPAGVIAQVVGEIDVADYLRRAGVAPERIRAVCERFVPARY